MFSLHFILSSKKHILKNIEMFVDVLHFNLSNPLIRFFQINENIKMKLLWRKCTSLVLCNLDASFLFSYNLKIKVD